MKRSAKRLHQQMNLPLLPIRTLPAVSSDQHKELTLALMEILITAARVSPPVKDWSISAPKTGPVWRLRIGGCGADEATVWRLLVGWLGRTAP